MLWLRHRRRRKLHATACSRALTRDERFISRRGQLPPPGGAQPVSGHYICCFCHG